MKHLLWVPAWGETREHDARELSGGTFYQTVLDWAARLDSEDLVPDGDALEVCIVEPCTGESVSYRVRAVSSVDLHAELATENHDSKERR